MAAWPGTLPQQSRAALSETRSDARVRTAMDAGPAKMRRRHTAAVRNFQGSMILTQAQRNTFDTFYITTLKEGSLAFDWTDPIDDTTASFRFISPAGFAVARPGAPADRLWEMTFNLELMP